MIQLEYIKFASINDTYIWFFMIMEKGKKWGRMFFVCFLFYFEQLHGVFPILLMGVVWKKDIWYS